MLAKARRLGEDQDDAEMKYKDVQDNPFAGYIGTVAKAGYMTIKTINRGLIN